MLMAVSHLDPGGRATAVSCLRSIIHPETSHPPDTVELLPAILRCSGVQSVAMGVLGKRECLVRVLCGLAEAHPELQPLLDEVCCPMAPGQRAGL